MYGFFIIAQRNALTPRHLILLIYCFLSIGLVGTLIANMRKGKRWSMITTTVLLILSLSSELLQVVKNHSTSHSSSLFILLFWLPVHLLALALILTPSSQHFFTRNNQTKKLQLFLKTLGLLSLSTLDKMS